MTQTHIEYDDFGEYVETLDLVPVAVSQAGGTGCGRLAGDRDLVLAS